MNCKILAEFLIHLLHFIAKEMRTLRNYLVIFSSVNPKNAFKVMVPVRTYFDTSSGASLAEQNKPGLRQWFWERYNKILSRHMVFFLKLIKLTTQSSISSLLPHLAKLWLMDLPFSSNSHYSNVESFLMMANDTWTHRLQRYLWDEARGFKT